MAIIDKFCPNCMNIIKKKDVKCSQCGMLVSNMIKAREKELKKQEEEIKKTYNKKSVNEDAPVNNIKDNENEVKQPIVTETGDGGAVVDTSKVFSSNENSVSNNKDVKSEGKQQNQSLALEETKDEVDYDEELIGSVVFEDKNKPKRHKHKRKANKKDAPQYTVDEDGSFNINTKDVTYLEGIEKPTSSVRKARGDMPEQEKLEWWEIYKWADRMLAKRKINKEVRKASTKTPENISRGVMLTYCILLGWLGIHNFYGGNKKKGWFVVIADFIVVLIMNIPVLHEIMGIFVGGGLGFVVLALWFTDITGLIFNKYRYNISKEEFISNLNVETRAKLGKKYINFDKTVFKEKEEKRLNKKKLKKEKKLNKKKQKLEKRKQKLAENEKLRKQKQETKPKKKKQETDYEIVEHKMDE